MRQPLILEFCVVLSNHVASNTSLEVGKNLGETLITHLFQLTQHSGFEEDLGVSDTILILNVQSGKNLLGCDFTVDESSWDGIWSQDGVSKTQILLIIQWDNRDFRLWIAFHTIHSRLDEVWTVIIKF